jgi:hypothetical protein
VLARFFPGAGGASNITGLTNAASIAAAAVTTAERFTAAHRLLQDDDAEQQGLYPVVDEEEDAAAAAATAAPPAAAPPPAAASEAVAVAAAPAPGADEASAAAAGGAGPAAPGEDAEASPEDEAALDADAAAAAAAARAAAAAPRKVKPSDELILVRRFWSIASAVERLSDGVVKFGLFSVDTTAAKTSLATHARSVARAVMDAIATDCGSVIKRVTSKFKHMMLHISTQPTDVAGLDALRSFLGTMGGAVGALESVMLDTQVSRRAMAAHRWGLCVAGIFLPLQPVLTGTPRPPV